MSILTDEEKVRIRHAMGYLNVQEASTFVLGVPAAVQTQFMIEGAWDKVLPAASTILRRMLCRCEEVEAEVFGGLDLAQVTQVSEIQVNPKRLMELAKHYRLAQESIANLLGVPPNPYDMRSWLRTGGGMSVPVLG